MKNYKIILVALLCGITIFSIFKYVSALKEKYELLSTINQIKQQVAFLENEKRNLLQTLEKEKQLQQQLNGEVSELKDYLKASKVRMSKLFAGQKKIEDLTSQISALKAENKALVEEKARVSQETEGLQAKLNSVTELKKAIRELKKQMHKVGAEIKKKADTSQITEGNRGFVIKDGKSTCATKVKIDVRPASSKE